MKKIVYISLVCIPFLGIGQNYFRFPDSNAIWSEHFWKQGGETYYQYGIIDDTIINSVTYHKVYYESPYLLDTTLTTNNSVLVGGIREDSLKRVFFYFMSNYPNGAYFVQTDSIYKLYDFSVQIGDTIKFNSYYPSNPYTYQYLILESIDSVFVYDHFRKRYHFNADIWIEGIGSSRSLFSSIMPIPTCICYWENVCFKYNNLTYYLNPLYHDCYNLSYGIETDKQVLDNINIYPNPIISTGIIDLSNLDYMPDNFEIYNILGEMIKELNVPDSKKVVLDRNQFNTGLYFYKLIRRDKSYLTGKILIE